MKEIEPRGKLLASMRVNTFFDTTISNSRSSRILGSDESRNRPNGGSDCLRFRRRRRTNRLTNPEALAATLEAAAAAARRHQQPASEPLLRLRLLLLHRRKKEGFMNQL